MSAVPAWVEVLTACFVVVGFVDIFAYWHSEDFGELRPVCCRVPLVDNPRRGLCEQTQIVGIAHEKQVGIFVPRRTLYIGLLAQNKAAYRI